MVKFRFVFLWISVLIMLAACAPATPEGESIGVTRPSATTEAAATSPPLPNLDGTAWELIEINGRPPLPNSRTTLTFENGNAGGYAGCNNYGGAYTANADNDTIDMSEGAINEALCLDPEGIMEQESAFIAALVKMTNYTMMDEQLVLKTAVNEPALIFAPLQQFTMNPTNLIGIQWQLMHWGERELPINHGISLNFDDGETMSGFAGCRHYEGSYLAENDNIGFPSLGMIEVTCDVEEVILILEGDFTTALSESTQYRLQEGQLELFTNPGEVLLFVPLAEEANVMQQPPAAAIYPTTPAPANNIAAPAGLIVRDADGHYWQMADDGTAQQRPYPLQHYRAEPAPFPMARRDNHTNC
jgi:heat shock protein HslJ